MKVKLSIGNIIWARIITEQPNLFALNTKLAKAEDSIAATFLCAKTINFTNEEFSQLLNRVKEYKNSKLPPTNLRNTNALLNQLQKYC